MPSNRLWPTSLRDAPPSGCWLNGLPFVSTLACAVVVVVGTVPVVATPASVVVWKTVLETESVSLPALPVWVTMVVAVVATVVVEAA